MEKKLLLPQVSETDRCVWSILLYLVKAYRADEYVPLREITETIRGGKSLMEREATRLTRLGLLDSRHGAGYRLHKAPEDVTVGAILRVLEAPWKSYGTAGRANTAAQHGWESLVSAVQENVTAEMNKLTLAQLASRHPVPVSATCRRRGRPAQAVLAQTL